MNLGFLNPAGAAGLAAVAALIVLYLYDRRRRVIPVGTLFLWKQIPASPLDRRRFRPDALFILQLVLLLALVGGYLRPYLERGAGRVPAGRLALVLDVSASMQAREGGTTRFDAARRRARALLDGLAAGDQAMLITAADRAHVVSGCTADRAKVREQLDALVPLDTATRLGAALELALGEAQARPGTRVAIFTDLPREASGVAVDRLAAVDYVQIGRTDDNLAIAGVVVAQPPFASLADVTVTVLVRNHGHTARSTVVEASIEGEPWMRRPLVLGARASVLVLLTAPRRPGVGMADAAAVVGWEREHPALSGFDGLQALRLGPVRRLATPAWGASIVRAAARGGDFPLLVAGEQRGRRVACLASGLGPSIESADGVPLVLLTLGTLRWLSDAGTPRVLTVETGVPVAADVAVAAPVTGVRVAADAPVLVAERTGPHRVGDALVLANLFDDRESDIGRDGNRTWAARMPFASPPAIPGRHEIDWWPYAVAAALPGVEWLVLLATEARFLFRSVS